MKNTIVFFAVLAVCMPFHAQTQTNVFPNGGTDSSQSRLPATDATTPSPLPASTTSFSANDYNTIVKKLMAAHTAKMQALMEDRRLILGGLPNESTPDQREQARQQMQQQLQANSAQGAQERKRFHAALNAA